jgi:ligand-binding SRPBCC domain-containing protein
MRLDLATEIDAPLEVVWRHVRTSALLRHVAAPLITFYALEPSELPEIWVEGRYRVGLKIFGWLPFGDQWIVVEHVETPEGYAVRDNGSSRLIRRWDHHITLTDAGGGRTLYRDTLDLEAGLLTLPVYAFAQVFYRHRQRRWRELARSGFHALKREA